MRNDGNKTHRKFPSVPRRSACVIFTYKRATLYFQYKSFYYRKYGVPICFIPENCMISFYDIGDIIIRSEKYGDHYFFVQKVNNELYM